MLEKLKFLVPLSLSESDHNHTLQTNPRYCEEEPQYTNSYKISGRQSKPSSSLFLIRKSDFAVKTTKVQSDQCLYFSHAFWEFQPW